MLLKWPFILLAIVGGGGVPLAVLASCIGVGCSCTASTNTMDFLNYQGLDPAPKDLQGNVQVVCSALVAGLNVSYNITLSSGNSGSYSPRKMNRLASNLNYNLYSDAAYSQIWGDGSGSTVIVSDSYILALFSVTRNYTIYGRIPALQTVAAGTYTDSIVATVNY